MKRSSCLSALLVGLSVTTASVVFAGSPAPITLAQAASPSWGLQPSDPTPAGGGADPTAAPPAPPPTAEPAASAPAAPAEPVEEAPPPSSFTLGSASGAPGVDAPNGSATGPKKAPKLRRWEGTQVFAATSMTTGTVFRNQNQYSDPTVDSAVYLLPRFTINDAFQLRARLVFTYEFTNSDETVTRNEPRFSDTALSLYYRKIPEIPGGIKPALALNVSLPTSPESRARTLYFSPGLGGQLAKNFEHIPGKGSLDLLATLGYSHPIYNKTTPEIRGAAPYQFACIGGTSCGDQLGGILNPSDVISYSFLIAATWGKFSPALFYRGASSWAYRPKDAVNPVDGKPITAPAGFQPTNLRQSSYFSAWLDYEASSWLTAEVGYSLERASVLGGDGTFGNPFFDRYQDQRVFVGVNFNIDNILKQLEGGPTEAGIVRAQNSKPIGQF